MRGSRKEGKGERERVRERGERRINRDKQERGGSRVEVNMLDGDQRQKWWGWGGEWDRAARGDQLMEEERDRVLERDSGLWPPVLLCSHSHVHTDMQGLALCSRQFFKSNLLLMPRISMKLNALFPPNKNSSHCLLNTNSRDPFSSSVTLCVLNLSIYKW